MEPFIQNHLSAVVVVLAALSLCALVVAAVGVVRSGRLERRFAWIAGERADTPETLPALLDSVARTRNDVDSLIGRVNALGEESRRHLKRVGLVRYDAFEGVAGQQSFSLCLLDDRDCGVLISSLVGTNFSRGYAVEIRNGEPARKLGDEEQAALEQARGND